MRVPALESSRLQALEDTIDRLTLGVGRLEGPVPRHSPEERQVPLRRALAAVDGSEASRRAATWIGAVAAATRAEASVLTVVPPSSIVDYYLDHLGEFGFRRPLLWGPEEREHTAKLLEEAAFLAAPGREPASAHQAIGAPVPSIVRHLEQTGADLVAVGSHGQGLAERVLLGSVAADLMRHAPCSVLVTRSAPPPRRILACVDGSQRSKAAAGLALRLARAWGAPMTLLHALSLAYAIPEAVQDRYRAAAEALAAPWGGPGDETRVEFGHPAEAILDAARSTGSDLVVLGAGGLGGASGPFLGSVGYRVCHEATASVLLVRPRRGTAPEGPGPGGR
jgi:nucleotide-binding universal stress UspA family protein